MLVPLYFESERAARKLSVSVVRRETFLDMVSIDDTFRRFTSRFIVYFVCDSRWGGVLRKRVLRFFLCQRFVT